MAATDWTALAVAIGLAIYFIEVWRRDRMARNGAPYVEGIESGERPAQEMPDHSRGWTTAERESHRLEAESARWIVERQQDEILRMYTACALDAERIQELERTIEAMRASERMRAEAEEDEMVERTATVPAKEGEAA